MNPPPYAPNVVNQTVSYNGVTWKGNPGGDWYPENGGGGGGGLDPATAAIYDATSELNQKYFSKIKDFNAKNPFVYDDILRSEISKAGTRLDPYYKQTLNDYMRGIDLQKNRSLEDQRTTLANLNADITSYSTENQQSLADALDKSRQGYADIGSYFSGAQERNTAKAGLDSNQNLNEYMRNKNDQISSAEQTNQRNQQDLGLQSSQFQRDVGHYDPTTGQFMRGQQSEGEVRSQAIPEVAAQQQKRQFELSQYVGAPPGVPVGQFYLQSYSGLQ